MGGGCEGGKSASWALPSTGLPASALSVAAPASLQPQLRLLLPGHVGCVLRHRGPGHVDSALPAPCPSCAEDGGNLQQPALWGQGQVGPGPGVGARGRAGGNYVAMICVLILNVRVYKVSSINLVVNQISKE